MTLVGELKKIAKDISGNVLTIGLDFPTVEQVLEQNEKIVKSYSMNFNGKKRTKKYEQGQKGKTISIKKIRKIFKKKRIDYIICNIEDIEQFFRTFIRDSVYINKNKLYIYGNKNNIDLELLEKYSEGLICLSACLAGQINQAILSDNMEKAKEIALWHKRVFGEDYYLEIQTNTLKEQALVNQKLVQLARKLDIPLVATNDAHYLKKEDSYNHEVLLCIQTGKRMSDPDRMKFDTEELYVKSPEEMFEYFKKKS